LNSSLLTLTVKANVPEARVFINGELAGTTPLEKAGVSSSSLAVRVEKKGFITATTGVTFAHCLEHRDLLVELKPQPVRGSAAVARSIVLPGWGQLHNKQLKKGLCLGAAEAVCLGLYAVALVSYQNSAAEYEKAQEAYATADQRIAWYKQQRDDTYATAKQKKT
jgi:hypothetical protein